MKLANRRLLFAFVVFAVSTGAFAEKPNVIVILSDDNDQLSWTIGGNCCKLLCFAGVSGKF